MGSFNEVDKDLVLAMKAGNKAAFDALYNKYKARMILFSIKFIKTHEIAEDIYHDIFTQIWIHKGDLDEDKSFSSFLYATLKNRLLDEIRKRLTDEKFRATLTEDTSHNETLNGIISEDFGRLYNQSLNSLTPQQRIIFSMSRNDNKTYKEIACHLNISINTVKTHLSQATSSMRNFLSKYLIS